MLIPGLPINNIGNIFWQENFGVLFEEKRVKFLTSFAHDIWSDAEIFNELGEEASEVDKILALGEHAKIQPSSYPASAKLTTEALIRKTQEIKTRKNPTLDKSSTKYVGQSQQVKYSNPYYPGLYKPKNLKELTYNESHIKASIADMTGFFINIEDFDRSMQSDGTLVLGTMRNLEKFNQERTRISKNKEELRKLIEFEKEKVSFLDEKIAYLQQLSREYRANLTRLNKTSLEEDHSNLQAAFRRKKIKIEIFKKEIQKIEKDGSTAIL